MRKVVAAVVVVLAAVPAARAATYTVLPVGPFNAAGLNEGSDINNANQVVGQFAFVQGVRHAFLATGAVNTDLGTLAGYGQSSAYAINDAGVVTGWSDASGGYPHPFVYSKGVMTDLGTLASFPLGRGTAINGSGRVVGDVESLPPFTSVGFLWDGATMTQLPSLGGTTTLPHEINAAGTIVGGARLPNGHLHAFSSSGGAITDLGTLPGDVDSTAIAENDAGVVVGWSASTQPHTHAVRWANGTIASLPPLPGGTWAFASDVNAAGVVVGTAYDASGVDRAVRWSGGTITDLNTEIPTGSGWLLRAAAAVNDNGWIVGSGTYNGVDRAFLLFPGTDTTPPSISCGSADGHWHAANVSIACTASDTQSGLANPADASFSLSTSVAAGVETASAATGTRTVCDLVGNCAVGGPVTGNKVDRKAPSVAIVVPASTTYEFNSPQVAQYACTDGGSGVASCSGPVANGSRIDTLFVGSRSFAVTATDAAGNTATTSVQYAVVATDWPQFHDDAAHVGVQPSETILDPTNVAGLAAAWKTPVGGAIQASPVVAGAIVYAGSDDGRLHAFAAGSGKELWSAKIGFAFGAAAVDGGSVFVGSDDGNVYAFDAATGASLWTFQTRGPVAAAPVVADGTVYVGSWDATLYALDERAGTPVWTQKLANPVRSPVAVADGNVYASDGDLVALDAKSGALLWTAGLWYAGISAPPVAYKGDVLVGGDDGTLYAVDASGWLLWTAPTSSGTGGIPGAPAVDGTLAYVGSTDGSLYAFDLASGKQVWSTYLAGVPGGWIWASPAVANGVVYVASSGTSVDAVDAQTGTRLWTAGVPDLYSSPAVADGTVYVGGDDGVLYAFRRP